MDIYVLALNSGRSSLKLVLCEGEGSTGSVKDLPQGLWGTLRGAAGRIGGETTGTGTTNIGEEVDGYMTTVDEEGLIARETLRCLIHAKGTAV